MKLLGLALLLFLSLSAAANTIGLTPALARKSSPPPGLTDEDEELNRSQTNDETRAETAREDWTVMF